MYDGIPFLYIDKLSILMMTLVGFIGLCVASFATRYLKGDHKRRHFFIQLLLLLASIFVLVCSDNLVLFWLMWVACNLLLTSLMVHKKQWTAANNSARIALLNFIIGFTCLGLAFAVLVFSTGRTSIQYIINSPQNELSLVSAGLIVLAAMTQSALWPFHRWLTSSLNSPTPVSAIMHAGLVNGGGFLLVRFAPLYLNHSLILNLLFFIGITTAILGTLWKLIQSDVKRMLACSTMGQMGFMIAQCGLGLFPAAITHLCWHGMFKAYHFLSAGSAAKEGKLDVKQHTTLKQLSFAMLGGLIGAIGFSFASNRDLFSTNTTAFLSILTFIALTQISLQLIHSNTLPNKVFAWIVSLAVGALYGINVYMIERFLAPLDITRPQPLNLLHGLAIILLLGGWLAMLYKKQLSNKEEQPAWMLSNYVRMLNASQPHPSTVTAHRNDYQF